jgi:hypothetical protein
MNQLSRNFADTYFQRELGDHCDGPGTIRHGPGPIPFNQGGELAQMRFQQRNLGSFPPDLIAHQGRRD